VAMNFLNGFFFWLWYLLTVL